MSKILIDEDLAREAMRALDFAAGKEYGANGESEDYALFDTVGFKLHLALGGCSMTITSEPEPDHAPEELTEDERDALADVVIDYEFDMIEKYGEYLKPGRAMDREGRAIKLAKSAIRKILGYDFGAQTKK